MVHVLFVCLGNICRSPMAEAVFRHKVRDVGLENQIQVDSAGTGMWHIGKKPHEGTQNILTHNQIDFAGITARQVGKKDFEAFQYIIAMDDSNMNDLQRLPHENPNVMVKKLLDFLPEKEVSNVPDPYYTDNFDEVYELIQDSCDRLLTYIRTKENV